MDRPLHRPNIDLRRLQWFSPPRTPHLIALSPRTVETDDRPDITLVMVVAALSGFVMGILVGWVL